MGLILREFYSPVNPGQFNALRRLGSGWAVFVEAQRVPATIYPESDFPDVASQMVDLERREQFEDEGAHFESRYFLTLVWLPPAESSGRAERFLYEGREQDGPDPHGMLHAFIDRSDRLLALLDGFMPEAAWLDDGETLTYLHSTISTRNPQSTFTDKAHQVTKRTAGKSVLPAIRAHLRKRWQEEGQVLLSFIERVADEGYLLREGDKPDIWLIGKSGEAHLALHRLLGLKKKELVALLSDANRPIPLSPPRLTIREIMASKPQPVAVPPEYTQRLEALRSRIRPRWKRSECRVELIACPIKAGFDS